MSFVLDQPEQISMWVLLSRRHQIQLHLKGLKTKGLVAALKREFPEVGGRYAKDFIVPVEFAISEAGGEVDYKLVNVHIMEEEATGVFRDMGIHNSPKDATTAIPGIAILGMAGRLEVVLTTEDVREPNGKVYQPA